MNRIDSKTADAGNNSRNSRGQFVSGASPGPGRPPGRENRSTVDLRLLKRQFFETFAEVNEQGEPAGLSALRTLRDTDPKGYLRLIVSLLPTDEKLLAELSPAERYPHMITTTTAEVLAKLEARRDEPYDPLCGRGRVVPKRDESDG